MNEFWQVIANIEAERPGWEVRETKRSKSLGKVITENDYSTAGRWLVNLFNSIIKTFPKMKRLKIIACVLAVVIALGCGPGNDATTTRAKPEHQKVMLTNNTDTLVIELVDSLLWGEQHYFYSVNVNEVNEELMKQFTDELPILRSVRVFYFDGNAPQIDGSPKDAALGYIIGSKPVATTFKLNLGNKIPLFYEGFKGLD